MKNSASNQSFESFKSLNFKVKKVTISIKTNLGEL